MMLLKALVIFLVPCIIFCEGKTLSREKYLEMKRHLRSLRKPAVMSIKTDDGDIFDCVDINKQLAFDHPLLKNHTIQMKPSFMPSRKDNTFYPDANIEIGLPGGGCPEGSVPIRRIQMRELLMAESSSEFGKKYSFGGPTMFTKGEPEHHHWAQDDTSSDTFYGTQVVMNVWEPNVVYYDKFSLAQFWISSGPYDKLNTVEAGWNVYPQVNKDYRVRLFVYWTADGYHKTGCLNVHCPGFVQVSRKIPIGARLAPVSTYNGQQYEFQLLAFLDLNKTAWWVVYGDEAIGYYPSSIFNSLKTRADRVHWGGEVYNPNEGVNQLKGDMPPMGSGHFAEEGFGKSAYMRSIQVVIDGNFLVDALHTHVVTDVPNCYNLIDKGHDKSWGRYFYFGGPGGKCI